MDSKVISAAGAAGATAGGAVSGIIGAPVLVTAAIGLVLAGGLCVVAGSVFGNSRKGKIHVGKDGFDGEYEK